MPLAQLYAFNVFKLIQFRRENGNTTQQQVLSTPGSANLGRSLALKNEIPKSIFAEAIKKTPGNEMCAQRESGHSTER